MLDEVNRWVIKAKTLIAGRNRIPLIDTVDLQIKDELYELSLSGDTELRSALDNVLSRDPNALEPRLVALTVYYRLTCIASRSSEDDDVEEDAEGYRQHLAYLFRLRDPGASTGSKEVLWEIVNACAV